ncbi:MAG: sodium:proton antiporter NhaD [Nitrosomonadales bacterium]|nr:sodium:proton antiporter NhaD [Nitrosomonadales bacterium]
MTPIQPTSWLGIAVLLIFSIGMLLIIFEAKLHMDKFKPALFMLSAFLLIGIYYRLSGDDPQRFEHFVEMQKETGSELFALIAFMAFMWMIVEMLAERGIFSALNSYLIARGLNASAMFWANGALAALLSPFINNITSAMIFGKSIKEISRNQNYRHVALCNLVVASNSGVWFLGTATSLMVVLAGKISIVGLLALLPAGIIGWAASAAVLQLFYLNRLQGELIDNTPDDVHIKRGGIGMIFFGIAAISSAVIMNIVLHIDIEYAIGMGLSILGMYAWRLKHGGHNVMLLVQLQKVEWNTLLFFIGIISGVAALNHVGWLSYISRLFETFSPIAVNVLLGVISGVLDNVPVEAAALMSNPQLSPSQWALNALMVGIGGSLTVIGSAAGVMVMSIDKSYSFGTHLKFLPAILTSFFVSLGVWYVQFEILGWHG